MGESQQNQQSGSSSQGGVGRDSGQKLSWGQPSGSKPAGGAAAQPPQGSSSSSRIIGTFVAGLIIGLLIAWAWFDLRGGIKNPGTTASSTSEFSVTQTTGSASGTGYSTGSAGSTGTSGVATNDAITVPDPQRAGSSVSVSSITSNGPVWAVVYSSTGEILGAARFAVQKSGTVPLLHGTVAGKSYWVGLVTDTPSHTWGNHADHQPVLGSDGSQVKATFTAQ